MFFNIFSLRPKVSSKEINEMGRQLRLSFLIRPFPEKYDKVKKNIVDMKSLYVKRKKSMRKQRAMYSAMRIPLATMFRITDRKIWDWEAMHWFDFDEKDGKFIIWWQGWLVGGALAEKNPSRGKAIDVDLKKICDESQGRIYFYDHINDKVLGKYDKAKNHPFYNMSKKMTEKFISQMKKRKRK